MNERDFCYWLQGFFELAEAEELNREQLKAIKEHLQLVFDKEASPYRILSKDEMVDVPLINCSSVWPRSTYEK